MWRPARPPSQVNYVATKLYGAQQVLLERAQA